MTQRWIYFFRKHQIGFVLSEQRMSEADMRCWDGLGEVAGKAFETNGNVQKIAIVHLREDVKQKRLLYFLLYSGMSDNF